MDTILTNTGGKGKRKGGGGDEGTRWEETPHFEGGNFDNMQQPKLIYGFNAPPPAILHFQIM